MKFTLKIGGRQRTFSTDASAVTNKRKLVELAAIAAGSVLVGAIVMAVKGSR